jgi:hypothetical protein
MHRLATLLRTATLETSSAFALYQFPTIIVELDLSHYYTPHIILAKFRVK